MSPASRDSSNAALKPTVVLLHGLARTWRSMAGMRRFLERAGYPTWAQTYPSRQRSLGELAEHVAARIRADLGDRPVVAVTHSLGGILVRHMSTALTWRGVVMLAPPNGGSRVAQTLGRFGAYRWFYGPAGLEVAHAAPWPAPPSPCGVIAGTQGPSLGNLPSLAINALRIFEPGVANDGTVAVDETRVDGMQAFATVPTSHTWIMNHPRTRALVLSFLETGHFPSESGG